MLCDICGRREAVLFVTQSQNGEKKEIHLCAKCAKERGLNAEGALLAKSLGALVKELGRPKKNCYACTHKLETIMKTGNIGCPECYIAFKDEITEMFLKKNRDLPYTGSMPKKLHHFRSVMTDRIAIQNKLADSVKNENYEKAAMYRDFLKVLDTGAYTNASFADSHSNCGDKRNE
ncbi:MAG TPA: DNA helicase UvrBC [Treponemataceae bacterium]|nr:DNA helicase UvrBC [Treponemataceae bacterium]